MEFGHNIDGFKELQAIFKSLSGRSQERVERNVSLAGGRVLGRYIKKNAPHQRLKKTKTVNAFRVARARRIARKNLEGHYTSAFVGFIRERGGGLGRLAHLFEDGTRERITKSGASRGRMRAHRFLARSRLQARGAMQWKMAAIFAKSVSREVAKNRRKGI